jgi:hypothetical protein
MAMLCENEATPVAASLANTAALFALADPTIALSNLPTAVQNQPPACG